MKLASAVLLASCTALSACAVTEPVVVIGPNGQTLRGTTHASMSGGSVNVRNGDVSCAGNYDAFATSPTITLQIVCSDGRKGIVVATRDPSGLGGHGNATMTDGTQWTFIFGPAAENF